MIINPTQDKRGAAAIITILGIAVFALTVLTSVSTLASKKLVLVRSDADSERTFYAAEAGINEALQRLKTNPEPGTFTLPTAITDNIAVTVTIDPSPTDPYQRIVTSRATDATNKQRTLQITANSSLFWLPFPYAVLSGVGGFIMEENSQVNGNIYSNGNIIGANPSNPKAKIIGDVWVAMDAGGPSTHIDAVKNTGNVYAHRIQNTRITGEAYTSEFVNSTVTITPVHPEIITPIKPFPIQDSEINDWKTNASVGVPIIGDHEVNGTESLGPKKIVGNLTFQNNSTLNVTGNIYVTGDVTISNNVTINKDPSLGQYSTTIIADGIITVSNGATISSPTGGYLMMLSTHSSLDSNDIAITANNGSNAIIYYAKDGSVFVENTGTLNGTMGKFIRIKQNVTITYGSSLQVFTIPPDSNHTFSTVGGSWQER